MRKVEPWGYLNILNVQTERSRHLISGVTGTCILFFLSLDVIFFSHKFWPASFLHFTRKNKNFSKFQLIKFLSTIKNLEFLNLSKIWRPGQYWPYIVPFLIKIYWSKLVISLENKGYLHPLFVPSPQRVYLSFSLLHSLKFQVTREGILVDPLRANFGSRAHDYIYRRWRNWTNNRYSLNCKQALVLRPLF